MATTATAEDTSTSTVEGMKEMVNLPQFWLGMGVITIGAHTVPFETVSSMFLGVCVLLYTITAYEQNRA